MDGTIHEDFILEKKVDYEDDESSEPSKKVESSQDSELEVNCLFYQKNNDDHVNDNNGKGNGGIGGLDNFGYNDKIDKNSKSNPKKNKQSKSKRCKYSKNNKNTNNIQFFSLNYNKYKLKRNYNNMIKYQKKYYKMQRLMELI